MESPHDVHHGSTDWTLFPMAVSATSHCITGCAIGEVIGLLIGTAAGFANHTTIIVSVCLSFLFGYSLSMLPLLRHGLSFRQALPIILAADTLSIITMELVDNLIMAFVPGAMGAGLTNKIYWITMPLSLVAAFVVAVPVNWALLAHGKGHALTHQHHHSAD